MIISNINKKSAFNAILSKIDKILKVSNEKEAKIAALSFELTFELIMNQVKKDIKKNYVKKRKSGKVKNVKKRLDKIIS